MTERLKLEVGLHTFLLAMEMDRVTGEIRRETPWALTFADGVMMCGESQEG